MTRQEWDALIEAKYDKRIEQAERNLQSATTTADRRKYATQLGTLKAWKLKKCA